MKFVLHNDVRWMTSFHRIITYVWGERCGYPRFSIICDEFHKTHLNLKQEYKISDLCINVLLTVQNVFFFFFIFIVSRTRLKQAKWRIFFVFPVIVWFLIDKMLNFSKKKSFRFFWDIKLMVVHLCNAKIGIFCRNVRTL